MIAGDGAFGSIAGLRPDEHDIRTGFPARCNPAAAAECHLQLDSRYAGRSQPATGNHRVLQAKSQEELKAYQDAFALTDPAQVETAANAFATKFPTSELRVSLYMRAMNLYAQANNTEKVIVTGRQAIAADPTESSAPGTGRIGTR